MNIFDKLQSSAIIQADHMGVKLTSGAKAIVVAGTLAVLATVSNAAFSAPFPGQQETPAAELPRLEIGAGGVPSIVKQPQAKTENSKPAELYSLGDGRMLEVQRAEDSTLMKAVRLGGGALGGGLLGSLVGGGNGNTIATIAGAVGGAILSDKVFAPKDTQRIVDGKMATAYPPDKYKFTNGKEALTETEYKSLDEWVRGSTFMKDQLTANRDNIQKLRRDYDMSGPSTESRIKQSLNQAMVNDTKLTKSFNDAQSHMSKKIWLAAMDYNKQIPEELLARAGVVLDYKATATYVNNTNTGYSPITTFGGPRYETVRMKTPSVLGSMR